MTRPDQEDRDRTMGEASLEERLQESENRLRELQRIANLGSWDWNITTNELWWSDQIYLIFGMDPGAFAATYEAFLSRVHPDDLGRVQLAVNQVLEAGGAYDVSHRIVLPDGGIRYVRERGDVAHDGAGRPVRMFGTVQDVTERHLAEDALRISESRLAAIIETAPEAVIVTGKAGVIEIFNQGAEAIFGYTAAEALGQPLDLLIPADVRGAHRVHMESFKESHEQRRMMDARREISGLRKDGTAFPAAASVSKFITNGDVIFVAILRDVSEFKRAELHLRDALEDAEKANRAKSEFLATMSHELRTPLNAILGFSEILRNEYLGPLGNNKYTEYADHIFDSGEYLLSLVNDLLDFSAIEDGRHTLDWELVCLHRAVHDSLNIVRDKAAEKDIKLIADFAPDLGEVRGDRRAIQQILLNLLSNSIKFTPAGGTIQISCVRVGPEVRIAVADTGIGIPAEVISTLTNPFRHSTKNPYRSTTGWGLGLPISKSLIDLHGGAMTIESEVDKGTTITVSLSSNAPGSCVECRTPAEKVSGTCVSGGARDRTKPG